MTCTIASSGEELLLTREEGQILRQRVLFLLLLLHKQGYTDFYINCNYGIPLWTGEMIARLKQHMHIHLHAALPHAHQAALWTPKLRARYREVHAAADSITIVSRPDVLDSYRQADEYMLLQSDLLLLYEGQLPCRAEREAYIAGRAAVYGIPVKEI